MWQSIFTILSVLYLVNSELSSLCGPYFQEKCDCGFQHSSGKTSFIVNCTNAGFVTADMLKHLPKETEILIFTGNNISSLPWNVFGEHDNVPQLHTVNLANNNIVEIPGKAFHHVSRVKRLILNDNRIKLSADGTVEHVHMRLFSNFFNLTELQLINAFDKVSAGRDDISALRDIFINSNLSKLTKLHLSNNQFRKIQDEMIFCSLPKLRELYLDANMLHEINFNISCLPYLELLSLKANKIENLNNATFRSFDIFPARGRSLKIDLKCNPWVCDYSASADSHRWMNSTKVIVMGADSCLTSVPGCLNGNLGSPRTPLSLTGQLLILFTVLLLSLVIGVLYLKRSQIRDKFNPLLDTVSHKMQYTTLRRREEPEVD